MAQGQQWHNSIGFITGLLIGSKKPKQIADAHMSGYVGLYEHMYAKIVKATKGMAQGQQWHNSIFLSLVTLVKHAFTVKCTYVGVRRPART